MRQRQTPECSLESTCAGETFSKKQNSGWPGLSEIFKGSKDVEGPLCLCQEPELPGPLCLSSQMQCCDT